MEHKMSSIQFVTSQKEGRLQFEIDVTIDGFAILIEVSNDSKTHVFVLPYGTQQCGLDLGPGNWKSRIGVMCGDPLKGTIEWSSFADPVLLESEKGLLKELAPTFKISRFLQILEGLRVFTTMPNYSYCLAEIWKVDESRTRALWYYYYTNNSNSVDIKHLQYTNQYNICIRVLQSLPRDTIHQVPLGITIERNTAVTPNRYIDATEKAARLSGQAITIPSCSIEIQS
jgi:hypothetical protein